MHRKISILIVLAIFAATGFFMYRVLQTKFDYNFEKFFPNNDPDTEFFMQYRDEFGSDNDFILIGISNKNGIFDKDFLIKIQALEDSLRNITDVVEVVSITSMKEIVRDPIVGFASEVPYLRYLEDSLYAIDSVRIFNTPELIGSLVASDGKAVALMINHTPLVGDVECKALDKSFREMIKKFDFDESHIAGRCIGQAYYTGKMRTELILFLVLSFAFIIAVLIVFYRSFWGVLIPLLLVGTTVIWTMGIMELTGKDVDMLGNAIPTIIVILGLSVAVHVMTKYYDFLAHGYEKLDALKKSIQNVGMPSFFTTLTTVVGFASLITVGITPIEDFGLYTAIGVAISFILSYSLLPAFLILTPVPKKLPTVKEKWSWGGFLSGIYKMVIRNKKVIAYTTLAISIISVTGTFFVKENTKLLEDLSDSSPIKKDFVYFGETFQGTRPFEMAITIKDPKKTVLDRDVLLEMEKMEIYLRNEYGLSFILSPVAIVKNAYKSSNNGDPEYYRIPSSEERLRTITREIKAIKNTGMIKSFFSEDFRKARVRSVLKDVGSNKANQMNEAFYNYVKENVNTSQFDYKLTGTAELIDKNNRNLTVNLLQGILISFVLITAIIAWLFKSWKMVLISLVSNVLPLLMMSAIMGIFGINLKISTAILFTIAFGIGVDDTIHFISKLRMELREDKSLAYAIKRTYLTAGKPIIITAVILCAGFGILGFSSFEGTKMIGILVSAILTFALIGDLIVLPALLLLFYRKKGLKVQETESDKAAVTKALK